MKFTVVSTSAEHEGIFRRLLPHTGRRAEGAGRIYFFYEVVGGGSDYSFAALDGEPLVEVHTFETLADADAWVTEDARQRQALLSASGSPQ